MFFSAEVCPFKGNSLILQFTLGHKRHQIRSPGAEIPRNSLQFLQFPTSSIENHRVIQPLGYLHRPYIGATTVRATLKERRAVKVVYLSAGLRTSVVCYWSYAVCIVPGPKIRRYDGPKIIPILYDVL